MMKVCITAEASGLDAQIDPRFSRSPFMTVVDLDTMTAESVPNQGATASGGAGIQSARMVARMGASALITGNVGSNAYKTLSASGIEVYHGTGGSVRDIVERFKRSDLQKMTSASGPAYSGTDAGSPRGAGRGGGRRGGNGQGGRSGW